MAALKKNHARGSRGVVQAIARRERPDGRKRLSNQDLSDPSVSACSHAFDQPVLAELVGGNLLMWPVLHFVQAVKEAQDI